MMPPRIVVDTEKLLSLYSMPVNIQLSTKIKTAQEKPLLWSCPLTNANMDMKQTQNKMSISGRRQRNGEPTEEWKEFVSKLEQ